MRLHFIINPTRARCSSRASTPRSNGGMSLQLSPCNNYLSLSSHGAQLIVFRPKVDKISLLIVNTTSNPSI
ncbi:hypothetical protein C4D60_Mb07t28210 [Musa balbisiana]|uniref:Uncharacterized protein n=1 Tax=Musa balbisiana TaxID=52838 RepID=A0A4S8JJV9_MUSBA|nr:hypothetical protein C4D60_Mb07t28210 [Musa balbisiana]